MKLFMTVNIHLEFQHGDRVFPTQVEKTEELDFLFVSLFERPCVIGRLTDKVARHSIYLLRILWSVVIQLWLNVSKVGGGGKIHVDVFLLNLSSLEEGRGGDACFGSDFYSNI